MRRVLGGEAELQPKPREYPVIAVDGSVVKCRGPTAVGVGCCRRCNEATHLSGWVFHSPSRTTANTLRFLRRLRGEVPILVVTL